jgi:DNA-binding XRE family transcriptional regulator
LRKQYYSSDTQEQFAVRIGVSKNTYCSMEKGSLTVSMASYIRVAELYGFSSRFAELFTIEESTNLFDDF